MAQVNKGHVEERVKKFLACLQDVEGAVAEAKRELVLLLADEYASAPEQWIKIDDLLVPLRNRLESVVEDLQWEV